MSDELDPDVSHFFQTGELTGSLQQQQPQPDDVMAGGGAPAQSAEQIQQPQIQQHQQYQPQPQQQPQQHQPLVDQNMVALRSQMARLQQYSNQLEQAIRDLKSGQTPQVQAPDPETDPLGHTMHELAEVKKMLAQVTEQMQGQAQMDQQTAALHNFTSAAQEAGQQFIDRTPDFHQAYDYIRNVRMQDMRDMGMTDSQAKEALLREEIGVSVQAMNNGQNPAEFIYRIAQRYGYRPQVMPQQVQTPAARMDALQRGQQAAPPNIQAASPAADLSVAALGSMGGDQLDRLVESDDLWHKVVGGKPTGDSIFH